VAGRAGANVVSAPAPAAATVLRHADDVDALLACFPVIRQLRPSLHNADDWLDRSWRMAADGYRVLAAWRERRAVAVAGYRVARNLIHGRFLYVDDLVTEPEERGSGLGARLLDELASIAAAAGCDRMVLDTAADNLAARRFFEREGLFGVVTGYVKPLGRSA